MPPFCCRGVRAGHAGTPKSGRRSASQGWTNHGPSRKLRWWGHAKPVPTGSSPFAGVCSGSVPDRFGYQLPSISKKALEWEIASPIHDPVASCRDILLGSSFRDGGLVEQPAKAWEYRHCPFRSRPSPVDATCLTCVALSLLGCADLRSMSGSILREHNRWSRCVTFFPSLAIPE